MKEYEPSQVFEEMDDATLAVLRDVVSARLAALREQVAVLTDKLMQDATDERAIIEVVDQRVLDTNKGAPNWAALLHESGAASSAMYKAAEKAIGELAVQGHHRGLSTAGYMPDTEQRVLRISLVRGAPELTRKVHDALTLLLPYIRPVFAGRGELAEDRREYKRIGVFESTLSQNGSYFVVINEAAKVFALCKSTFGRTRTERRFAELLPLLEYIEQSHPYEDARERAPASEAESSTD